MSLPNIIHGSEDLTFAVRTSTTGQGATAIGAKMIVEDGRSYRFTHVGVGPTIVGHLWQAELVDIAKLGDETVGTVTQAQITSGTTTFPSVGSTTDGYAADVLKGGYVIIDSAANLNPLYQISSNVAITAAADGGSITVRNQLVDPIAAAETISYVKSPWMDVIQCPAPLTAAPAGVPVAVIADEGFGWLQTGGACRTLTTGTLVLGDAAVSSATTAGGFMPSAAQETDGPYLGLVMIVTGAAEYSGIFLNFDC